LAEGRIGALERFQAKWRPVRVKKTRQLKNLKLCFDSIETERAPVRTFIVLISPCGSRVLHGMRQRPPVLRHSQRIASIEPPLTERTPGKVIGIERSVLACASSEIGHIKP
jgi:hypothetical protein